MRHQSLNKSFYFVQNNIVLVVVSVGQKDFKLKGDSCIQQ